MMENQSFQLDCCKGKEKAQILFWSNFFAFTQYATPFYHEANHGRNMANLHWQILFDKIVTSASTN